MIMSNEEITERLLLAQDLKFRAFQQKIVPDTKLDILGVKMPEIRKIVKETSETEALNFFSLSHRFYEENLLHGLLISKIKDENKAYALLNDFVLSIDNWAICDSVAASIKNLAKNKTRLLENVFRWLSYNNVYTVRFGIVCLLDYFCDSTYSKTLVKVIKSTVTDEYYINMALSWLISVMLVKDYNTAVKLLKEKSLPAFVQNKAIDKAKDSFRISENIKKYLKTLKI